MLRIPDRFWWVQRYGGLLGALGCLVGAIQSVLVAQDLAQLAGDHVIDPRILHNEGEIALLQAGIFALFIAQASIVIWASFGSRERFQRRQRAIEGDQEAIPRAALTVDTGSVPRLSSDSLEFLQQASVVDRRVKLIGLSIALLFGIALAGLSLVEAYALATTNPAGMALWERGTLVFLFVGVAAGMVVILIAATRYLPSFLGKPYGVSATDDGLWYYLQTGRRQFLRWEEFRLFEVIPSGAGRYYQKYKLYSGTVVAAWSNDPPSSILLSGLAMQEFRQRHQALPNLIVARTGLLPRTFDKKLAEVNSGI